MKIYPSRRNRCHQQLPSGLQAISSDHTIRIDLATAKRRKDSMLSISNDNQLITRNPRPDKLTQCNNSNNSNRIMYNTNDT
jgi:hypothetical protein